MDWLRRNWPDLVIGVALVAVVALIVVTLLSGGSLASLVRRDTPPDLMTGTTGPATPGGTQTATTPGGTTQASAPEGAAGGIDVFVPEVPGDSAGAANQAEGANEGAQAGAPSSTGTQTARNTPAGSAALPSATDSGGFRVAAGAVDARPAAVSLAESYRESGLPVTIETQDDLFLLWVGPYATRPEADRVAERIIDEGGDALVYTYDGGGDAAETPEAAPQEAVTDTPETTTQVANVPEATAPAATAQATAQTPTAQAPTATATGDTAAGDTAGGVGQRYLQVGAFVSDESAAPLRAQLETLGLSVSRTEDEAGLVRLFVGPFGEARLAQAQSRLSAEGIVGSFPVTR